MLLKRKENEVAEKLELGDDIALYCCFHLLFPRFKH